LHLQFTGLRFELNCNKLLQQNCLGLPVLVCSCSRAILSV